MSTAALAKPKNPDFCVRDARGKLRLNLHPGQTQTWDSLRRFIFMQSGTQGGKALDVDTPIPTPYGFKTMGELEVGDKVFNQNGGVSTITFATPIMFNHECFEVEFDDGSTLVADAEHLWTTKTYKQRKNQVRHKFPGIKRAPSSSTLTTKAILETLDENHSIKLAGPIQYPERDLPVPPYTFGAWLGDGLSERARIVSADPSLIQKIHEEGVLVGAGRTQRQNNQSLVYSIGRDTKGGNDRSNPILDSLRLMGVIGNKHIPEIYLNASIVQRTALIMGLMDTDGYCAVDGECEFSTTSQALGRQVQTLLASLGVKSRLKTKQAKFNGKDYGPAYRVMFTTDIPVFALPRKLERQIGGKRPETKTRYIRRITPVHTRPVRCIQVDSPSHLYLAGRDYIPTHNTCFGPHWLKREIDRCGPGDYLAVTATYPLLKNKMLFEFLRVFVNYYNLGVYKDSDKMFTYFPKAGELEPTRIIFGSAANPESIESATAKAAWLDEVGQVQWRRASWEAVLRRLSLAEGRILGTTTLYGLGWQKTEVYDRWMAGDEDYDVIQFDSIMNPAFSRNEWERARRTMPSWKFNLFYRGRYDKPAGLIYDAFDENHCRIRRPWSKPPENWLCFVGHDFGPNNTAAIWFAQNPETGLLYCYREYLKGGLSSAQHAANIIELSKGENIIRRVGGAQTNEDGYRDAYTAAGWPILKPNIGAVAAGIDRVYDWHKSNKMYIFEDLGETLDELQSYSYKLDENYEPTMEIENKEHFHMLDAMRYVISDLTPIYNANGMITPVERIIGAPYADQMPFELRAKILELQRLN